MTDKQKTGSTRKSQAKRPNRAQVRAAEVRASETRTEVRQAIETGTYEEPAPPTSARSRARQRKGQQQSYQRPAHLTRAQEYAYIRSDFRRLLITAGTLLAVMMVILVVVEG